MIKVYLLLCIRRYKFADIVRRTGINRHTAQFLLKSDERLPGMPPAGKQGVHREFDIDQALRLALATELVKVGVPSRNAGAAVLYCEQRFRRWKWRWPDKAPPKSPHLFEGRAANDWFIQIVDTEYVQLFPDRGVPDDVHLNADAYFSLSEGRVVSDRVEFNFDIKTETNVNASAIRRMLIAST